MAVALLPLFGTENVAPIKNVTRTRRRSVKIVKRTLRVAALQLAAHDRAAFERGDVAIAATVRNGAAGHDLLVLPEGTLPAYVLGDSRVGDTGVERALEELREIARANACAIVVGAAVRRDGTLYNSAVAIDSDGSIAGSAEKIFLWHFDRKWFAPGRSIAPIETRVAKLGVMICADGRMPGIASALADAGAELLAMPTAWVTSGRDPSQLENLQADLLARVRAYENGLPFVAANKCGTERSIVAYCGKSQIVHADGTLAAMASQFEPQLVSATVTVGANERERSRVQVSPQRPPSGSTRIAFSLDAPPFDLPQLLETLDADEWLGPDSREALPAAVAYDPRALPRYRAAGYRRIVLRSDDGDEWLEPIARARAAELRLYAIVFDLKRRRAYAIDPDGAVIAGTFDGLRVASAAVDYARTEHTLVAPGTDVAEGLEFVESLQPGVRA